MLLSFSSILQSTKPASVRSKESKKDTILDLDIWRNPQRVTNEGTLFPLSGDLTILNSFLTIRFHGHKLLIISKNLLLDVLWPPVQCTIFQCITAPGGSVHMSLLDRWVA